MIPSFESRHSLGGRACPMFGGGDSSSASTSEQTNNTSYSDSRSVTSVTDESVATSLENAFNTSTSTALADSFNTSNSTALADSFNTSSTTNTSYTTTDMGAVSAGSSVSMAALGLGGTVIKQNSLDFSALLNVAKDLFAGTQKTVDANAQIAASLTNNVQQAYKSAADAGIKAVTEAAGTANNVKPLMILGLAALALIAFVAIKK